MIDLKTEYPELADAVINGELTRDQALVRVILHKAVADLTDNVPDLMDDIGQAILNPCKFKQTATELDRLLAALIEFDA